MESHFGGRARVARRVGRLVDVDGGVEEVMGFRASLAGGWVEEFISSRERLWKECVVAVVVLKEGWMRWSSTSTWLMRGDEPRLKRLRLIHT